MAQPSAKCGIGQPVRRTEDARLLTGRGNFSDDLNLAGQAYAAFARCPHAHARIVRVRCDQARRAPGVLAILTGADYLEEGLRPLPADPFAGPLKNRGGSASFSTPDYPLAFDKVRHAGEAVALVVAQSRAQAKDAAELIEVDYEELPSCVDAAGALVPGRPPLWDEVPDNLCVDTERGDRAATDAAFAQAAHVATLEIVNHRVSGTPLEPRAAVAEYDAASGKHTLYAGSQGIFVHKRGLCAVFGVPEDKVRVVTRDTGGGFGTRHSLFREFVLVVWAARRIGRPVKWTCERSEAFLSEPYGRDLTTRAQLALDRDGRFLALRAHHIANVGSHLLCVIPLQLSAAVPTGVYSIAHAHLHLQAVFTNTLPTSVLRGAGRPEAMFVLERLIDVAADEMQLDRLELRRRNIVAASMLPFDNPVGTRIDSGDFPANMERAIELADWRAFEVRRALARERGVLRGIGLSNYIDAAGGMPEEQAVLEVTGEGRVRVVLGTQASGQGHETAFAQMVVEFLGVPLDAVQVHEGDSEIVKKGSGTHSSRSARMAGLVLGRAAEKLVAEGRHIAAAMLEVSERDLEYAGGRFRVAGTDRSLGLFEVAAAAPSASGPPRLAAFADNASPMSTYANGCQVCEVEIDPETGAVALVAWNEVHDAGRVVNPLLVDGQTHGGIVQGVGQALCESCVYDRESGQLLSGSFADYALPRADQFPGFVLERNEVPTPSNPLGIKGSKGGILGAGPSVINAVVDALKDYGVRHVEMPATAQKIWSAMQARP